MDFFQEKFKQNWKWLLTALVLACLGLGIYIRNWQFREPLLELHFFSLNKGRAIFIRTPENKTILIGGGQNSEVIREITGAMPFYSHRIDYVIVPSATPAQIGGLIEIIERYEVEDIIMPKLMATSTVLTHLMKEIRKKKIHIEEVERGDELEIEKDVSINVLFPYEGFKYNKSSLPELAFKISYKDTSAYLMGNLSKTIQKDILKNTEINGGDNIIEFYNSMVEGRVSEELLEKINPEFTFSTKEKTANLVSDGLSWEEIK